MKSFIFFSLLFLSQFIRGQNLVMNPSFEDYTACPHYLDELNNALYWFDPVSSSDLYNACGNGLSLVGVPSNICGHQPARTGTGYAGIITYGFGNNGREYIEVKLIPGLTTGNKYLVSFYVSLSDTIAYACGNIGAYFSQFAVYGSPPNYLYNYTPQIANNFLLNPLTDKNNWTLVADTFTATGTERYMTIGNFDNDTNSPIILVGGANTAGPIYYYIDDVSVIDCTNGGCITGISPLNPPKGNLINIYPNPVKEYITISFSQPMFTACRVRIIDIMGKEVYRQSLFIQKQVSLPVSNLAQGNYVVELNYEDKKEYKKFIKE